MKSLKPRKSARNIDIGSDVFQSISHKILYSATQSYFIWTRTYGVCSYPDSRQKSTQQLFYLVDRRHE